MNHAWRVLPFLTDCGAATQNAGGHRAGLGLLVSCVPRDHRHADARPFPYVFLCLLLFLVRDGGCLPCPVYYHGRAACPYRSLGLGLCGRAVRSRAIVIWIAGDGRDRGVYHPDIDHDCCLFGLVRLRCCSDCGDPIRPTWHCCLGGFDLGENGLP